MKYISLFSGIGGLESANQDPILLCEREINCINFLKKKYKNSELVDDVKKISSPSSKLPKVDIVTGGWPCQDLSVAGERKGFEGKKSVLFYDLLQVAINAKSETIIAENVPNLLTIDKGLVFATVLQELSDAGYIYISWRVINSREFNLPHQRRRLFIVASKSEQVSKNLFNNIQVKIKKAKNKTDVYSFYHTAGTHSICFCENYVPTLKVSGGGAAIHHNNIIRRITGDEAIRLQGFKTKDFINIPDSQKYSMAGNAVSKPIGNFIFESISKDLKMLEMVSVQNTLDLFGNPSPISSRVENGFYKKGNIYEVLLPKKELCSNLSDLVDLNINAFISNTAILGLLRRASKAKKPIDIRLLKTMIDIVSKSAIEDEIGKAGMEEMLNPGSKNKLSIREEIEETLNF